MMQQNNTCEDCCHYTGKWNINGKAAYLCELTNALLSGKPCEMFNKDLSDQKICLNCEHYLGGGDWGLSCAAHYHMIVKAFSEPCEQFCRKKSKAER